jgi:hypothetical protein
VHSILRRKQTLHPLAAGALVGMVGCGLLVGAVELSRGPQLVAFVAASKPDTHTAAIAPLATRSTARVSYERINEPNLSPDDAVFQPSGRYRAVDTKSIVPAKSSAAVTSIVARSRRNDDSVASGDETAMTDREAAPHQVMVNAASTPAASSPSQEFIVLTAWEEVKTSVPQSFGTKSREVADYETGADAQTHSDDAASERNTSTVAQISVTRLILLVVPANTATGSPAGAATGTRPARTTGSRSHRPTAAAFDGGWLFFQL